MAYTESSNFAKKFCKKMGSAFKKAYKRYDVEKGDETTSQPEGEEQTTQATTPRRAKK